VICSRVKVYDRKADPATHNTDGRVRASEHEGEELISLAENDTVKQ